MQILPTELEKYFELESKIFANRPQRIKVTKKFSNFLEAKFTDEIVFEKTNTPKGYISYYTGIPSEIDDTIENEYYEIVY